MSEPRVLVVEDDPDDVHFLKRAFSQVCPTVSLDVARDGQEAVDRLSGIPEEKLPFVLLDLKLPKKPGLEVLEWIRATPKVRGIRVMILSASKHENEVAQATKLGVDAYLVKPNGYPMLVTLVRKICQDWGFESLKEPIRGSSGA